MATTEFNAALRQVANDRNIDEKEVIKTLKEALIAAYKKDNVVSEEDEKLLTVEISPIDGQITIKFGKKDVTPIGFGRIASQTAKQVILQKIREAEKNAMALEYKEKINSIVQGYIFRVDKDKVVLDIGKTHGVIPLSERVASENYLVNQKYKVLIKEVIQDEHGAEIILSRKDPNFIIELFKEEVPEMSQGLVKIEKIAREAGQRTKIAVSSTDPKIDASGACIGQKGVRVQAVTDELNGEKIDIVSYSYDLDKFVASALSPATVVDVKIDDNKSDAFVTVEEDQFSLAIGNNGQNVRLAAKLTGLRININGTDADGTKSKNVKKEPKKEKEKDSAPKKVKKAKKTVKTK